MVFFVFFPIVHLSVHSALTNFNRNNLKIVLVNVVFKIKINKCCIVNCVALKSIAMCLIFKTFPVKKKKKELLVLQFHNTKVKHCLGQTKDKHILNFSEKITCH